MSFVCGYLLFISAVMLNRRTQNTSERRRRTKNSTSEWRMKPEEQGRFQQTMKNCHPQERPTILVLEEGVEMLLEDSTNLEVSESVEFRENVI